MLNMRSFFKKYGYSLTILYLIVHILWFFIFQLRDVYYRPIHCPLDDAIPFCEWFIIPYVFWFLYLFAGALLLMLFAPREDYTRFAVFTFGGLFICMMICTLWPSCVEFRPASFERSNILIDAVRLIYSSDQPANVFPSMHCYGAFGATIAYFRLSCFKGKPWIKVFCAVSCVLICASTVFIKQHSVLDFLAAVPVAVVMYPIAYCVKWKFCRGSSICELLRRKKRMARL